MIYGSTLKFHEMSCTEGTGHHEERMFDRSPVFVDYIVELFDAQSDVFFLVNCAVCLCVLDMLIYVLRCVKTI